MRRGEATLLRMQALDILYDRSASDDCFDARGNPFSDRFFFQIIPRRAYDAHDAVDSQARMVRQKQNANTSP